MSDAQMPSYLWHPRGPGFVAQREHTLRLSAWCSVAGVTLNLAAVVIGEDGCPRPVLYTLAPTSNRVATVSPSLPLEAGQITCVQVFASAGAPIGAQCYVRLELLQGREGATTSLGTIMEGYVTANVALVYPGDNTSRSVDGRGTFRIILGTVPGAGAEILETVPANTRWMLQAFSFTFTASVAVASRTPILTIDDGVNVVWETFNNTAVTASQVVKYRAGSGVQLNTVTALDFQEGLPETLLLPAGSRIRTITGSIQGADQYSAPVYCVEEWLDV